MRKVTPFHIDEKGDAVITLFRVTLGMPMHVRLAILQSQGHYFFRVYANDHRILATGAPDDIIVNADFGISFFKPTCLELPLHSCDHLDTDGFLLFNA